MNRIVLLLIGLLLALGAPSRVPAQEADPSETFLKAYMTSQQAEKLEREEQLKPALAKFRFAGALLEELKKSHADWQPAIVEYRGRKIGESILRVENKLSMQKDLAATAESPAPAMSPPEPSSTVGQPSVDIGPKPAVAGPDDGALQNATKELRARVDSLESELKKTREQFETAQKEKEQIAGKLKETTGKLDEAQDTLGKTQSAEREITDQLAQARESLKSLQATGPGEKKGSKALRAQIAELQTVLESAKAGRAAAEKESASAKAKLKEADARIAAVTGEREAMKRDRDSAIDQLRIAGDAKKRVDVLVAENSDLKGKLAAAEKAVREIGEDKPKKAQELAEVKRQLEDLRNQLVASQKQNQDSTSIIADLRAQLDETSGELAKAKLAGANSEETIRLTKENDMLRAIVMRERQEEAKREQAKKLVFAEFDKLKIKSETLNQQIELLAAPITKLSDDELALLKKPVVGISEVNPASLTASLTAPKQASVPVKVTNPDAPKTEDSTDGSTLEDVASGNGASVGPAVDTTFKPGVPEPLLPIAREAKQNFDRGNFHKAEKQYQQILAKSPNNLYSLSNLGVVLFRNGKLKAAELTLKKAIVVAPQDEFSHTTLGIVYYRQSKFDDALSELTKSLALNPKSATAHNYLGITASQKGWQEAAEKEMLEAIAENPNYADAHFNLAVIYATAQPPARELAKRHYDKARSLGAESDPSLEKLLR